MVDRMSGIHSGTNPLYVSKESATNRSEGLERAKSFDLSTSKIEIGTAQDSPKPSKSLGQKIKDFFAKIGKAIADLFDPDVRRANTLSRARGLPDGVKVGSDGMIDCRVPIKLHDTALIQVELSEESAPITPIGFMEVQARERLDGTRQVQMPDGNTIMLNDQVCRDFGRMDIEIPTSTGSYHSPDGTGAKAESQLPETAQHLRAFAGSDEGARVLSSFTNQYTVRNMIRVMESVSGNVSVSRVANSQMPVTVDLPDGETLDYDKPPQLSEAHFKLSKTPEGDFRIEVEWPTFVTTYSEIDKSGKINDGPIRVPDGHALKQTVTLSFVLDAEEASRGNIKIIDEGQPFMTIQGRIDVERTLENM